MTSIAIQTETQGTRHRLDGDPGPSEAHSTATDRLTLIPGAARAGTGADALQQRHPAGE
jgi:hypothetical protein